MSSERQAYQRRLSRPHSKPSLVLFGRSCVSARSDDPDRRVACEGATRVVDVSYHSAGVVSGELLESELKEAKNVDRAWLVPA